MEINDLGRALIEQREQGPNGGPALTAYQDAAGVWTVGWGHTFGIHSGSVITREQAEELLDEDLEDAETTVNHCLLTSKFTTTSNQFSAMVSLCFNIGDYGFQSSSVLRRHLEQDFPSASNSFLLWDKAHVDGQLITVTGLLDRRKEEAALYMQVEI